MSSIVDSWEAFFRNSGVPSNVRRKYAHRFVKERIQPNMLRDIGKSELRELGVDAIGDQLCIMRYIKSSDGMMDEFKTANKQQTSSSLDHDDDYLDDMDTEERDEIPAARTVKMKPVQSSSRSKTIQKREPAVIAPRISSHSRVIRKKPVMIHDVSSSSPIPAMGKMRSDLISLKTTVVAPNLLRKTPIKALMSRREEVASQSPDFRVRLNVRPQVAYNTFLDEQDDGDAAEKLLPSSTLTSSRVISVTDGRRRMEGSGPEVRRLQISSASLNRPTAGPSTNNIRRMVASTVSARAEPIVRRIARPSSATRVSLTSRRVLPSVQVRGGAGRQVPIQARIERRTKLTVATTGKSGILGRISMVNRR